MGLEPWTLDTKSILSIMCRTANHSIHCHETLITDVVFKPSYIYHTYTARVSVYLSRIHEQMCPRSMCSQTILR